MHFYGILLAFFKKQNNTAIIWKEKYIKSDLRQLFVLILHEGNKILSNLTHSPPPKKRKKLKQQHTIFSILINSKLFLQTTEKVLKVSKKSPKA